MPTIPDRLGLLKLPQLSSSIWVHAVSVGEVKATEVLVEQLRRQFPGKPVVVSHGGTVHRDGTFVLS